MKWGEKWSLRWGWIETWITNTAQIRKIMGNYVPCKNCRWFRVCVVPKGRGPNLRKFGKKQAEKRAEMRKKIINMNFWIGS